MTNYTTRIQPEPTQYTTREKPEPTIYTARTIPDTKYTSRGAETIDDQKQ